MIAHVTPAEIVGHHQNNVRALRCHDGTNRTENSYNKDNRQDEYS